MNLHDKTNTSGNFSVGLWKVSPESGMISNVSGEEVYLEPRLAKLFCLLCQNSNKLVPRKLLIDEIWSDTIVNEESLTRAVSDLRKTLKAHFVNPPKIETIPKRGYKMIISASITQKPVWKKTLKYVFYSLLAFILLMLIIRGINY